MTWVDGVLIVLVTMIVVFIIVDLYMPGNRDDD